MVLNGGGSTPLPPVLVEGTPTLTTTANRCCLVHRFRGEYTQFTYFSR